MRGKKWEVENAVMLWVLHSKAHIKISTYMTVPCECVVWHDFLMVKFLAEDSRAGMTPGGNRSVVSIWFGHILTKLDFKMAISGVGRRTFPVDRFQNQECRRLQTRLKYKQKKSKRSNYTRHGEEQQKHHDYSLLTCFHWRLKHSNYW